ncbi:MAG: FtsX-like permease family protein [Gemmatimonadales bacterium]|nr:FtsX-like permease family protein [Gemmatimonadales bacterium]NIO31545.1 FtsX-like permease family protein [Gemmatimonadota bacterium]
MQDTWQDLRYGIRQLNRRRVFTCAALAILAIGIGGTTAIYTVVRGVYLDSLPYESPDRLVFVWEADVNTDEVPVSDPNFADWRDQNHTLERLAALTHRFANLSGSGDPGRVVRGLTTPGFFDILRTRPILGRGFSPSEEIEGNERVAIISHDLWIRRFEGEPSVLGNVVQLDGEPYAVIGVLPPGFQHPSPWWYGSETDVWTPLVLENDRGWHRLIVIGRLREESNLEAARADFRTLAARLSDQYPETNGGNSASVVTLHEQLLGDVGRQLFILLGVSLLVLLVACGNVASLLLARGITRQNELAIRSALGASRTRLIRQLLVENLPLSLLGGALGLIVGMWGLEGLQTLISYSVPRTENISIDMWVLVFAVVVSVVTGVVFAVVPAATISRARVGGTLRESGRGEVVGRTTLLVRNLLVVGQLAVALVLVNGAALMVTSYRLLSHEDRGFDPKGVLTVGISLSSPRFAELPRVREFFDEVRERISALPGVRRVGVTSKLPFRGGTNTSVIVEGREAETDEGRGPLVEVSIVDEGYFGGMGIPLVAGRNFTPQDTAPASAGVIINRRMAQIVWPEEEPIGKRVSFGLPNWYTVVGVVGDVRQWGLERPPAAEIYMPYSSSPPSTVLSFHRVRYLIVRSEVGPHSLVAPIRHAVSSVSGDQPISQARTMEEIITESMARRRFSTLLVGILTSITLILVAAGVYGVMSYFVAQRSREIGIRMALGAARSTMLREIVVRGVKLTLIGATVGLIGVLWSTRVLSNLVYGISPTDPATIVTTVAFLLTVGLLSSAVPAVKATQVDPMVALRAE